MATKPLACRSAMGSVDDWPFKDGAHVARTGSCRMVTVPLVVASHLKCPGLGEMYGGLKSSVNVVVGLRTPNTSNMQGPTGSKQGTVLANVTFLNFHRPCQGFRKPDGTFEASDQLATAVNGPRRRQDHSAGPRRALPRHRLLRRFSRVIRSMPAGDFRETPLRQVAAPACRLRLSSVPRGNNAPSTAIHPVTKLHSHSRRAACARTSIRRAAISI